MRNKKFTKSCFAWFLGLLISANDALFAQAKAPPTKQCIGLVRGELELFVDGCRVLDFGRDIQPNAGFFYKGLPPADQKVFQESYSGLLLSGKVTRSSAKRGGLSTESSALMGESIRVFVPAAKALSQDCSLFEGQVYRGKVEEACCTGGADVPCLLKKTYVYHPIAKSDKKPAQVVGTTRERLAANESPFLKRAKAALSKKDKNLAHKELSQNMNPSIDERYFHLVLLYEMEKYAILIKLAEETLAKRNHAASDKKILDRIRMLNARSLALLQKADEAVLALRYYLIEPQRNRAEIEFTLKHRDFRAIESFEVYKKYEKDARNALQSK